jgi:manganese/iron transport system permease protein
MVTFFDESHARSIGLNARAAARWSSSPCSRPARSPPCRRSAPVLVIAMVVTPGATAYLLTDRFPSPDPDRDRGRHLCQLRHRRLHFSSFLDGATGGVIVVPCRPWCSSLAFIFAPKHGMLAARRRRLAGSEIAA